MIQQAIEKLIRARDLTRDEAAAVMEEIMTGQATPAQFGAFVVGLRLKGETVDELTGLARVMRAKALRVEFDGPMVDTCGTGGDDLGTFNISTVAAFVVAGTGITVAKHGNRAMSSHCGSADILEKHGIKIDLGPDGVKRCMEEVGIGFMFAPAFHPAMKFAVQPRREIGVRTVFNILGPLTNPARAQAQVLGVAAEPLGEKMILVLQGLGSERAMVVHGEDGLDEISIIARTHIWELRDETIKDYWVSPEELGLEPAPLEALKGGSVEENTAIMVEILKGAPGPRREVVLANVPVISSEGASRERATDGEFILVPVVLKTGP
ncbi:MAG: anthranilate phosphoribosyltransferase [Chloroflexi bacterium]|nr:anthranilate phosphoribosyltransferase [Chloroflexota bacterium]